MSEKLRAENFFTRVDREGNWKLRITSYKLGDKYVCVVDNVDPGARLAHASAATRQKAELKAVGKARHLVRKTRRFC